LKLKHFLLSCLLLGGLGLGGCVLPVPSARLADAPTPALGRWEAVHTIRYSDISKENLKGHLGPAYLVYMVSMAGFQTESFGISIGPDDDVRSTTDGGQSWTKSPGALFCRHGMEIVDARTAWHCGNGGTRVSTDGGRTWRTTAQSACPYLSFLDARSGWAASPDMLQSTADGGQTWTNLVLPADIEEIAAIELRPGGNGYLLDAAGRIFVTTDGGRSWDMRSLGLAAGEILITGTEGPKAVMRFADARRGTVIFDLPDRTVWFALTSDGGRSWRRAEISELRDQSYYYHLFLSRDGSLLTATDDFNNGANLSIVLRYREP
jgi:photosystem II stability/assembly factor-like uncharacterized protein